MLHLQLAPLQSAAHGLRAGLRGEDVLGIPIGQAEEALMQPDLDVAAYQAAGHAHNAITLRAEGSGAGELFSQAGDFAPPCGVGRTVSGAHLRTFVSLRSEYSRISWNG